LTPSCFFIDLINRYYDSHGETVTEAQLNSKFYPHVPAYSTDIWAQWARADMPLAMVPFVLLAELAGITMPLHRGMIDIFGAILEEDFWETGLALDNLGLADLTAAQVVEYVTEGS